MWKERSCLPCVHFIYTLIRSQIRSMYNLAYGRCMNAQWRRVACLYTPTIYVSVNTLEARSVLD